MTPIFEGIRVVEVAEWTFVPSATAILAEFGADVVKVERPGAGDVQRGMALAGISPIKDGVSYQMEASNRGGKRSVGIDITTDAGRDLVHRLAAQADVFVTSLLPKTQRRLGFTYDDIRQVNERIVYAAGSGLGTEGPESERGGYDMTAYWCRSGLGAAVTAPGSDELVQMRPAMGDRSGAMNLFAGIAAALLYRERSGHGTRVDVSLLGTGVWQIASDVVYSTGMGEDNSRTARGRNPLVSYYRTLDDRWMALTLIESDRWWPRFAEKVGLANLIADPIFVDAAAREANFEQCKQVLVRHLATGTLDEWRQRLDGFQGPWEPVQSVLELADDPQVVENGVIQEMVANNGRPVSMVAAPIRFGGEGGRLSPCPEPGADTEMVLLEHGVSWDEMIELKKGGCIT